MTARTLRRAAALGAFAAALALAGCDHGGGHAEADDNGNTATASITIGNVGEGGAGNGSQSVSINVPGFSAKLNVPDMDIGSDTTQIEDMKIFPGTSLHGVNIAGKGGADWNDDHGHGTVRMAFTAPGSAPDVIAWYKHQAEEHGWTAASPANGNQFEATKQEEDHGVTHFAIQVSPASGGSSGQITVTGD